MKKSLIIFIAVFYISQGFCQKHIQYSADSSRITYASFQNDYNQNLTPDELFSTLLDVNSENRFVAIDTAYSPDSSFIYVKYVQTYAGYYVENSLVVLTYHHNSIVRFTGCYTPIQIISLTSPYEYSDAESVFDHYYNLEYSNCRHYHSMVIVENGEGKAVLCYKIQGDNPSVTDKTLYLSAADLSIVRESYLPNAGFNATFHTRYNGVRQGYNLPYPLGNDTLYILQDFNAAVEILTIGPGVVDISHAIANTYYNHSNVWGADSNQQYPNYILDAYWSASEYSLYLQNKLHCNKEYFQRQFDYYQYNYFVNDTLTPIYIPANTYVDITKWNHQIFYPHNKEPGHEYYRNIIIVGAPGNNHNPKASIDDVVHEFAHIFSYQSWSPFVPSPYFETNIALAEACADIWAAVITYQFYPEDENKIWKIGEEIVLPTSGKTCVRNLAFPSDPLAETPMLSYYSDTVDANAYQMSGVISHWFYLLTHGYSDQGANGVCYNFSAIPIDTAAKLMYYCEYGGYFRRNMTFSEICNATLEATEIFNDKDDIRASVIGAWKLVGVELYEESGVERFGLSLSSSNQSDYTIDSDLIIDSLTTLTIAGTLHCAPSARIIVRPGGKLVVDGGTLTSACAGEMWQGIYVEGHRNQHQTAANQGTVQLINGAVIENAHRGIYTGAFGENWHTTGGIVTADSATFRNCAKAVEFLSYADTIVPGFINDNWSSFTNCTFTVDNNNLFAANNTDFLAHVTMWDVKGVRFTHCRFEDVRTGFHTRKSAISTIDAGFKIKNGCDYTLPLSNPDCNCYLTTNTYCSFSGFGTAINAATSGNPYAVSIDGARFTDNEAGVKIEGNNHATVTRCTFDLNVQTGLAFKPAVGLFLDTCTGYLVEENTFSCSATAPQYQRYGILVGNSGPDANSIYRNDISNMSVGVYVQGDNAKKLTGLQFTCNVFSGNENDIYVETNATIGVNQGSPSKGADNTFSPRATSNLYNGGTGVVNYYYSTGSGHAPSHTTNVNLYGTAGSNMCGSTICGYNPGNPGGGPKSPTPGFLALKQQYENLFADFDRNGFANLLTATIPPTAEPPTLSDELVAAQHAAQQINDIATELYAQSHAAVRALISDTLEDVQAVHAWLDATPGLASRYLAAETGFVAGADAVETHGRASLQDIAAHLTTAAERAEYDNYVAFHALKEALSYGNGHVAWPHATDAQVWELVRIADANTGRSSLLAKNVLCFFFGICYDDDMETRALATTTIPPQAEPPTLTGQQNVIVHPNPTDNVLHVSVTDGEIARIEMFDSFGRVVPVETHGRASLPSPTTTVNTSDIPSGVYVLRVTLTDGTVRTVKVVKK